MKWGATVRCCCRGGEANCRRCLADDHAACADDLRREFMRDPVRRQAALERLVDDELRKEWNAVERIRREG